MVDLYRYKMDSGVRKPSLKQPWSIDLVKVKPRIQKRVFSVNSLPFTSTGTKRGSRD